MIGHTSVWTLAPPPTTSSKEQRQPNGFVILDRAWAARLDVRRVGGVYRIRRRELVERLERLQREELGRSLNAVNAGWPPAGPATGRVAR